MVEVKMIKPARTINQNKYLHVCIGLIAKETGYTMQEAKIVMKREHGLEYEKNGKRFLRSTRELDTGEMTKFIDWMRNMAGEVLGIYIPTSEEYLIDPFS